MSKKILILDDEEGIRESLKLILENDYDLVLAEDPIQGLEMLENDDSIKLMLLDIKMPKINGMEVLKLVKEKYKDLKVIMVTGYNSTEMASEATKIGADSYINKPFKTDVILETVARLF